MTAALVLVQVWQAAADAEGAELSMKYKQLLLRGKEVYS